MAYDGTERLNKKGHNKWVDACFSHLDTEEKPDKHRRYDDHIFLVYMHVNKINGKIYIGITHHVNPNRRWGYSGQKYKNSIKFARAIEKYGWDNFDHIILCRTSKERAVVLEKAFISVYKKKGISYNITDGGDGADCVSENNRRITSERMRKNHPMKGKHHTPEARRKISEANKRRVYSAEHIEKLRKAGEKGRKTMRDPSWSFPKDFGEKTRLRLSKPVLQLDLEGNILKEFSSTKAADMECSKGAGHHVADVCNGKRKTAYGFKWKYKNEEGAVI